jgi:hypothetical protein
MAATFGFFVGNLGGEMIVALCSFTVMTGVFGGLLIGGSTDLLLI